MLLFAMAGPLHAGEPYVPPSGEVVLLQRTPGAARALRAQRAQAAPTDPAAAEAAARAAIQRGRDSGDPRYFGQAQALLAPWASSADAPPGILLLAATLQQQRHAFDTALGTLDRVLALTPRNAQARLTRATVLLVQGRPVDARRDCAALLGQAGLLPIATCLAMVNAVTGKAAAALDAIEQALLHDPQADAETRRWAITQAADIAARLGDAARAERWYRASLDSAREAGIHDVYLEAAYADWLLAQGRAQEVVTRLAGATAFDALLLRLALAEDALARAGDPQQAAQRDAHRRMLAERFALGEARGDVAHTREMAMAALSLDHAPRAALELARRNWAIQRELVDARLLVQAARDSGDPAAAQPVFDWARDHGIDDPMLKPGAGA